MGWKWFGIRAMVAAQDSQSLLLQYYATSDAALLSALFQRYADALYHFLLKQSNAELAQDLSQQCWLLLLQQANQVTPQSQFQGQSSVKTWLFSVGRNLLLDEFRRQQKWTGLPDDDALPDPGLVPVNFLQQLQRQQQLDLAIGALPFVQREALMLQLEDFSLQQIALIVGSPTETIKTRLRYARQNLKQLLEETDEIG